MSWGKDPDPSKWAAGDRASGVTWLTPEGDLNGKGDERMHEAYLCGLSPSTTYSYRVGGGPSGGEVWSDVYSFTTTPPAGDSKVIFGVTGDSRGQQNDAWRVLQRRVLLAGATMQLFSGDMVNPPLSPGYQAQGGGISPHHRQQHRSHPGPSMDCLPKGGPDHCFHASFKVSSTNGEHVHLVDAQNQVVSDAFYPAEAVPSGQTWGRVPDMTGDFKATDPTPSDPNKIH